MTDYLLYGLGPATILTIVLVLAIGRDWSRAVALAGRDPKLARLAGQASSVYAGAWARGILWGCVTIPMAPLALFHPADTRIGLWCILTYWFPASLWAFTWSWTRLFRSGVANTLDLLHGEPRAGPVVAYLRDRAEERRTMVVAGPNGEARVAPLQRGIENLVKQVPGERIFGFWDPLDDRSGLDFSPLLSVDEDWQEDVAKLCRLATLIVLDISVLSPSVEWEALLVRDDRELREKTLLLRAGSDDELPPSLADLPRRVRWVATFSDRSDRATSSDVTLPSDFLALANGRAVWARRTADPAA